MIGEERKTAHALCYHLKRQLRKLKTKEAVNILPALSFLSTTPAVSFVPD